MLARRASGALDAQLQDLVADSACRRRSAQRRYTSASSCISTCSKPLPPQVGAAAGAGIEAEGAGRVACAASHRAASRTARGSGSKAPTIAGRIGARGAADGRLVHQHRARSALSLSGQAPCTGRRIRCPCRRRAAGPGTAGSVTSVLLPEPDTPVTHTSWPSGTFSVASRTLCRLAPCSASCCAGMSRHCRPARAASMRRRPAR